MGRKNYIPGSDKQDKGLVPYEMVNFSGAVVKGIAASQLPENALADAHDVIIYPTEIAGREGNVLYTTVTIPPIDNRTGYTASMTDDIITASANIFTADDISNYFVFPGNPDKHYEIVDLLADNQVRVHMFDTQPLTTGCWLRGKTNLMQWQRINRKWIFMWGQQIYCAELALTSLVRCRVISRDLPNNAISGYDDFDNLSGLIFNSNGIFKINFEYQVPLVYKINVPVPDQKIDDKELTNVYDYLPARSNEYHYVYSCSRLFSSENIVDRLTPAKIELETGSNEWDDEYKDYSTVYYVDNIGVYDATDRWETLLCGVLVAPYNNYAGWRALASPGSFKLAIFNISEYSGAMPPPANYYKEIVVDFSNVLGMGEVREAIEIAIKKFYSGVVCIYNGTQISITTDPIPGMRIYYMLPGTASGTIDISAYIRGTIVTDASVTHNDYRSEQKVEFLYIPKVVNTIPQEYQWHFTHYSIYRTKDLLGRYKIDDQSDQFNSPNDFVLVKDLRTCAAFYGYLDVVEQGGEMLLDFIVTEGEFEVCDRGCTLELDNGDRFTIIIFVNGNLKRAYLGLTDYYSINGDYHAACIGNGRVMRASQTGNIVTRTHGSLFTADDVRKPLKWATGYYSYVTEYIDANTVRVADDQDKTTMGLTLDPRYRSFRDDISDDVLDARMSRLKLKQRFWQPLPNCNVGKVVPGLILCAQRNNTVINYCQIADTLEYLHGYHDKGYQVTRAVNGDIQMMWLFQDVLIIWTANKTWRWNVSSYQFLINPLTKDAVLQISGLEIADEDRGCFDWGSIEPIGDGSVMMLTSEKGSVGWRQYNGYQYGQNVLEIAEIGKDRIPDIQKLQQATKAFYDSRAGMLLFGRE